MQFLPQLQGLILTMEAAPSLDPATQNEFRTSIDRITSEAVQRLVEFESLWLEVKSTDWTTFASTGTPPSKLWPVFGRNLEAWARRTVSRFRSELKRVRLMQQRLH